MFRPTNKKELLELAEINLNKLLDFIDGLSDKIKNGIKMMGGDLQSMIERE
jgi:hypothetical protein